MKDRMSDWSCGVAHRQIRVSRRDDAMEKAKEGSGIYLGEDGGPDGLNLLDLGGTQKSLELVGLNEGFRG